VDEHQVAFVSQQREQRGLAVRLRFQGREQGRGFGGDLAASGFGERAPCRPAEAHHLVQRGVTFESERNGGRVWLMHSL